MTQDVKFEHSKTDDPEDDEYDNDGSINSAVEGDDDIKRDDDYDDDGNDDGNSNNQRLSDHRDSRSQIDLENELVGRTVAARVQTSKLLVYLFIGVAALAAGSATNYYMRWDVRNWVMDEVRFVRSSSGSTGD
jgi:hypothetical protein